MEDIRKINPIELEFERKKVNSTSIVDIIGNNADNDSLSEEQIENFKERCWNFMLKRHPDAYAKQGSKLTERLMH